MALDINLLLTYIITVIVFLITPGPIILMMINISVKHSPIHAIKTIVGTNLASLILITLSFLMVRGLILVHDKLLSIFTILGALYILWMAIDLLKTPAAIQQKSIQSEALEEPTTPQKKQPFLLKGFLLGLSNPKDLLFFMVFFPTFFGVMSQPSQAITLLTIVWVILDFSILSLYALLFYKLITPSLTLIFSRLSGLLLFGLAIYIIIKNSIDLL